MDEVRQSAAKFRPPTREEKVLIRRFEKIATAAAVAGALSLFVAVAPQARADDKSKCQHAVEKAEARFDRAVQQKGERSREAEDRRRDLNAERERCWGQYHRWWNGKEHRWETEHNWDADHDHH